MASINCTFSGYANYNNGWYKSYFTSGSGMGLHGFGKDSNGYHRCMVFRFVTPTIPDSYTNKTLTINIPMCRSTSAGAGTDTFKYRVSTVAPTFSEGGNVEPTFPTSYLCAGTANIYNNTQGSGYTMRSVTTAAANFKSETTYYFWMWSDTPYSSTATGINTHSGYFAHSSSLGLISVSMSYDVQSKSTMSIYNGTLGTAQTLTITKASSTSTHTITYTCGTASGTICTKSSSTSIAWTPPMDLAYQNTSGVNVTVKVTIVTYEGSTEIGGWMYTISCLIPTSVYPTATYSVTDATSAYSKYGNFVQGISKILFDSTVTLAYNSPIVSFKVTVGDDVYTSQNFTTDAIKNSGTLNLTVNITDQRSRSSGASKSYTVLEYTKPAVTKLTVQRCNSDGTVNNQGSYVKATFSATVTPLGNKNTATYVLNYKKTSETDYTGVALDDLQNVYSVTDYSYVFEAGADDVYDVEVTVEDSHYGTNRNTSASTGFTLMHWKADGTAMAVGRLSTKSNAFQVGLEQYDMFDTLMGNGVAAFTGTGSSGVDPDTTLEGLCLTNLNTPSGKPYYINTLFYNTKSETTIRTQIAFPYNAESSLYIRYYKSGTWSDWTRYLTEKESLLAAYPVNSIYISYSHTSPASLFGGTWTRISPYFLYGTGETGTIGETGGSTSHTLTVNEMPSHTHTTYAIVSSGSSTGYAFTQQSGTRGTVTRNQSTGGGQAFDIVPPFIKVSIWRRTA